MAEKKRNELRLTVAIPPHKVEVRITDDMPPDRDGEWDGDTYSIYISPASSVTKIEQTISHELLHALATIGNIPFLQDEDAVLRMEHIFYLFLKYNTNFFGPKRKKAST